MTDLAQRALVKYVHKLISDHNSIVHVCNDPVPGDNPGEHVFWVQYPFKDTGLKKDLGKQYRITITEDDL